MGFIGFTLALSVFLAVMAGGMRVAPADLACVLRSPRRLIRALAAMNLLFPVVVVLVCRVFDLHPAVVVALVTLSIAPVDALFSQSMLAIVAPGYAAYARGLLFASTVLSVILTPIAVEVIQAIYGGGIRMSPWLVTEVVVGSVLLPLGLGLALARWRPAMRRMIEPIEKASTLVLIVGAAAILVGTWSYLGLIVRRGTATAIVLIALAGEAIGHLLGGPDEGERTVLASATISRHPGVAIELAALVDQSLAPIGILLAVLVSQLTAAPYKRWRKRLRAGVPASAPPPARAH